MISASYLFQDSLNNITSEIDLRIFSKEEALSSQIHFLNGVCFMKIIRRLNRNKMFYNKLKLGLYNLNMDKLSQQHYQNSNKNKIEDILFSQ